MLAIRDMLSKLHIYTQPIFHVKIRCHGAQDIELSNHKHKLSTPVLDGQTEERYGNSATIRSNASINLIHLPS